MYCIEPRRQPYYSITKSNIKLSPRPAVHPRIKVEMRLRAVARVDRLRTTKKKACEWPPKLKSFGDKLRDEPDLVRRHKLKDYRQRNGDCRSAQKAGHWRDLVQIGKQ